MDVICFKCQTKNDIVEKVHYRDECEKCGQDLHVCKQCQHYDPSSYNECKETSADRILEKEKANYCDFYLVKTETGKASQNKSKSDLLAQAEALFKKKN